MVLGFEPTTFGYESPPIDQGSHFCLIFSNTFLDLTEQTSSISRGKLANRGATSTFCLRPKQFR